MDGVNLLETVADAEFYETMDLYTPQDGDYFELVKGIVPADWRFGRNHGIWYGCSIPEGARPELPTQGWKIHVSSTVSNAKDVLKAVVPILVTRYVDFKFALDEAVLSMMNNKRWVRQGAGKFITIYPRNHDEFVSLIEELYQATKRFEGPYILSDRRYKDSRVIFYRYGGISSYTVLNVKGERVPMMISPSGENVPDIRRPYFYVPEWTKDPFQDSPSGEPIKEEKPSSVILKDGRYIVKSAIN